MPNIHRDMISERMHYAKERERMAQRIDELHVVDDVKIRVEMIRRIEGDEIRCRC